MSSDREYFNARAQDWDNTVVHDESKVEHIVNLLQVRASDHILDVGTGTGVLIPHLLKYLDDHGHITAVDVSEKMLEVAESKYSGKNITYRLGDVLEMPMDEKFDVIICFSVFPHFKENKLKAIGTLSQLLNDGGKLCIAHAQSREAINNLHLKAGDVVKDDRLPKMDILEKSFVDQGLIPECVIDNENHFIILGKKMN
ncbi:MAG: class I SAM-dependent methyltransferase [Bacillota bacterium]|nr:class I SAM-dependent methyltransferase [Bacillota bacterium]